MEYIAELEQLQENMPFKTSYLGTPIVLYKSSKGIFAVEDRCSHEEYPLSESQAVDSTVECKKHGSVFDLATGKALSLPAFFPVTTYNVVIDGNKIYIDGKKSS